MLRERFEEVREYLEGFDKESALAELMEICQEYGQEEMLDDLIHEDNIDMMVENELKQGGWTRVAIFLSKVEYLNDEYYVIDGYGNLTELTQGYVECLLADLQTNLEQEMLEEEGEEEEDEE